jgi:tRNA1(Val) A37 N6-methylase TrmN6
LLEKPFPYDVLFVDYRLDGWQPLSHEFSMRWGLPDSVVSGRLFEPAISPTGGRPPSKDQEKRAVEGGHCELLIQLATQHNVLIVATSFHTDWTKDPVPQLRAMGAHHFLSKQGEEAEILQAQALVMTLGGDRRDRRLWGALSQSETKSILSELQSSGPEEVLDRIRDYTNRRPSDRDKDCVSATTTEGRTDYLIKTLGWLREPRLNCAQELFDEMDLACRDGDLTKATRLFSVGRALQPTVPMALEPGIAADGVVARPIEFDVAAAYKLHNLIEKTEYLHLEVGDGVKRVDFYSSQRLDPDSRARCEYLGTSFSPRLAAAIDRSGVWPPRALSKLRHLLRAPRESRVYHQGGAIVRGGAAAFGPTIDTYLLGDVLNRLSRKSLQEGICLDHVVELGLGTGHLSCVLLACAGKQIRRLFGSEVSVSALDLARQNIQAIAEAGHLDVFMELEPRPDFLTSLPSGELDLIISNPPYLPVPKDAVTGTEAPDSATAGEKLIKHILIDQGPRVLKPGGAVLLVSSTLTRSMINDARSAALAQGVDWYPRKLESLPWVPLDLPEVQDDPSWLRYLLEQRAMQVYFDLAAAEFPLRHSIEVRVFSRSPETSDAFARATSTHESAM